MNEHRNEIGANPEPPDTMPANGTAPLKPERVVGKGKRKRSNLHRLLGEIFKELLTPLNIIVDTDFPVMSDPPEADILILSKEKAGWTPEQLKYLPDGVRDSYADHILLEFKYTESINHLAIMQALAYLFFYTSHRDMRVEEVRTFLLSSKTPVRETLDRFGYVLSEKRESIKVRSSWSVSSI